jgi:hypothetical protein
MAETGPGNRFFCSYEGQPTLLFTGTFTPDRPLLEVQAVAPLEKLFVLEVEFARRLRTEAPGTSDASSLHTSYALQAGYEQLIAAAGRVTVREVEALATRLQLAGDARDTLRARDSLIQLLGIQPFGP